MKLKFDYFHNLEKVDFYLCNPDGRQLYPIVATNRKYSAVFNDLSTLTFDYYSTATLSDGSVVELEAYDYIETKRLIFVTDIGWFQITNVEENDSGISKYKSVSCESYQSVLKNKGVYVYGRVYALYNPNDPYDERFEAAVENEESVPSVLGQLYVQYGIAQDLEQGKDAPDTPYDDWTVTYVNTAFLYAGVGTCRNFEENASITCYEWLVNEVQKAFGVIVLFDYYNKTIQFLAASELTQQSSTLFTFSNFIENIKIEENSENIVTVMTCNGQNCDISEVNPTGTSYICDFSYYKDSTNHRWMSDALITKLNQWEAAVETQRPAYVDLVQDLRDKYLLKTRYEEQLTRASKSLTDLQNSLEEKSVADVSGVSLFGIVKAELVNDGETSLDERSAYHSTTFTKNKMVTAYDSPPTHDPTTKLFYFSGTGNYASANDNYNGGHTYFLDDTTGHSYCKLVGKATVNTDATSVIYCSGFEKYIDYTSTPDWVNKKTVVVNGLNSSISSVESDIEYIKSQMKAITNQVNIISYFSNTPLLLKELSKYWIEGDYTNDNISILETTTPEEEIDLCYELLESGQTELSKVAQPRLSFSVDAIDATKIYEFRDQMNDLELGKIIPTEKEEGLWFYPALLKMEFDLDNSDAFSLEFANRLRLDDWGYTYADLIADASSTSRQVSANWTNLMEFPSKAKEISDLITYPLDATLRSATINAKNQNFQIDDTGILGRKLKTDDSGKFEPEQVRMINNLIIFTDDGWETAKAAFGKINYTDPQTQQPATAYGLIAETIIGSLIMGNKLEIKNANSTVSINAAGIIIKNGSSQEVFHADTSGNVSVTGTIYSSYGQIGGWNITSDKIYSSHTSGGYPYYTGMKAGSDPSAVAFYAHSFDPTVTGGAPFYVQNDGYLFSSYGSIGGWDIGHTTLTASGTQGGVYYLQNDGLASLMSVVNTQYLTRSSSISGIEQTSNAYIKFDQNLSAGKLAGTWTYGDGSGILYSDVNKKNSITEMDSRYDSLFDSIEPIRYKYNSGTSDRYHTGFIAQQVLSSIISSGMDTSDFAAYCDIHEDNGDVTCGLRYEEFVALNTWQIQKLKSRVTELERIVAELTNG